jgi:hypothetical protein
VIRRRATTSILVKFRQAVRGRKLQFRQRDCISIEREARSAPLRQGHTMFRRNNVGVAEFSGNDPDGDYYGENAPRQRANDDMTVGTDVEDDVQMVTINVNGSSTSLQSNGASLPTPEEFRASNNAIASSPPTSSKRCAQYGGIWFLSMMGITVILILVSGSLLIRRANQSNSGSGGVARNEPRRTTTQELIAYLEINGISSPENLYNESSPHYRTVKWMADEDGLNLFLPNASNPAAVSPYIFLQRYVLALLFFSTNGDVRGEQWDHSVNFLQPTDTCDWRFQTGHPILEKYVWFGALCKRNELELPGDVGSVRAVVLDLVKLHGTIPSELGLLRKLHYLNWSFNPGVVGTLPASLCQLTELQSIESMHTQFTGTIPSCIHAWKNTLQVLWLSDNQFSGPAPLHNSISQLTKLVSLALDDNAGLTGNIATAFNSMTELRELLVRFVATRVGPP